MKKLILFFIPLLLIVACNTKNESKQNTHQLKVRESKGIWQNPDSFAKPISIPAGVPKTIVAGKPTINPTNLNVHIAGLPKVIIAGIPKTNTPGIDTFLLPQTIIITGAPSMSKDAGIPETVIAKDMANKDQNPANFSTYGKLQGLKHGTIRCMLQDKSGNLWFGTYGGGVSKYDGKSFSNFTNKEGLANNTVFSILEDKSGNLWFGTDGGGVSKYDGKSFSNFTNKEGLANNTVRSILKDKSGNLWFGTDGGVSKYDGKSFSNFTDKEGLANNFVWSILEDKSGNLWFGTYGGVSKYDGKSFSNFTDKEGLADNFVLSILKDKSGNLWFGTYGGVSKYDGKSFSNFTDKEGLANNTVWSVLEDKSGNLWLGTDGGVSKYDGKSFSNFTDKEGLANNTVWSILEDKSGNLWFGTDGGGVSKYDGKSFSNFTDKEGLANNGVFSVLEDKSGNLWFGTYGGGVSKYDGKSFSTFTYKEGLASNSVFSILEDKSGNLWFGTDGGGASKYDGKSFSNFTDKEGLANNTIWSILEDKSGNLWFGTDGGGVSKYDGKSFRNFTDEEGLADNFVLSMSEDKSGNLWFGTYGGVSKYDGKSFTTFTDKEGLANNTVWSILEDKSGNLWFGSYGDGVSKYDGKSFSTFTDKEGLANNTVLSMLEDKSGNLWFGTRFGLSKLTLAKLVEINNKVKANTINESDVFFKNYTYSDGFLGIGVNGGKTMLQDKQGDIWIGANNRLTLLHTANIFPDTIAPNIQINSIELFNENIAWANLTSSFRQLADSVIEKESGNNFSVKDTTIKLGNGVSVGNFEFDGLTRWYNLPEHLSLAYNNNYLTFNFIGITMNQSRNVKYQYKLDGLDENWSAITNRTNAPYGNLPHGIYTFKVKAMNSEGVWSKEFSYAFVIRPPWWQKWWFRTLVALLIIGSVWYYIKSREKKFIAEKEKLEKTVEERTVEVVLEKEESDKQRKVAEEQKQLVEEKHKEITDSINYAERIQRSFLASKELLDENLRYETDPKGFENLSGLATQRDYFVYFKPKDIVSGDFYWADTLSNGKFALVTADSTGHGVPGAIMSLLNITSLENAVKETTEPAQILNLTRQTIITRLKKDGSAEGGKDGMDCSIIVFDKTNNKLIIAGANNPVWIVRTTHASGTSASADFLEPVAEAPKATINMIEIEPDKMPVGKHDRDTELFTQHVFDLQTGDIIYTLTDGFPDQFGGEKGKKFMSKNLKELLLANAHLPMHEQKQLLETTFKNWIGNLEQVDDVCVIGIRI